MDLGEDGRIILKSIFKRKSVHLVHMHQKTDQWRDFFKAINNCSLNKRLTAVSCLRPSFAGVSLARPIFNSVPLYVGFVVNKVTLREGFQRVILFSPPPVNCHPRWSTQPLTEMSTRNTSWGVKAAGA